MFLYYTPFSFMTEYPPLHQLSFSKTEKNSYAVSTERAPIRSMDVFLKIETQLVWWSVTLS